MTYAEFIENDLQARLEAGLAPPCKLTYHALARHYKVSLSPVRAAVEQLLAKEVLVKGSNGRLDANHANQSAPRNSPDSATLPDWPAPPIDLEKRMRADIIHDSLLGNADYLREEAAAKTYQIGRTALRPILARLAGQGLLVHVPRCGWRVRKLDEGDFQQYLECREALEIRAVELAHPHFSREDLEQLLESNRTFLEERSVPLDNRLHQYWIAKARNLYIQDFFERNSIYYATLLDHAAPAVEVVAEMATQHCEILKHLLGGRLVLAKKALSHHIRSQGPVVNSLIQRVRDRQSPVNTAS